MRKTQPSKIQQQVSLFPIATVKSKKTATKKVATRKEVAKKSSFEVLLREIQFEKSDEQQKVQNISEMEKRYYSAKIIVRELERRNNSQLILFESLGGEPGEWLKMIGNSALFYRFDIGPRIGKKPVARHDNDLREHVKGGVVAVHWIDQFAKLLKENGWERHSCDEKFGIHIFNLNRKYSTAEIKEFRTQASTQLKQLNELSRPKAEYPDVWYNMLRLASFLPPKVKRMKEPTYRMLFGAPLIEQLCYIFEYYIDMANGGLAVSEAKVKILHAIDKILARITIIAEVEMWDVADLAKLGDILTELKTAVKTRVKENRKGELKIPSDEKKDERTA